MVLAASAVSRDARDHGASRSTASASRAPLYRTFRAPALEGRHGRDRQRAAPSPAQVVRDRVGPPADAGAGGVAGLRHRAQLLQARRHAGGPGQRAPERQAGRDAEGDGAGGQDGAGCCSSTCCPAGLEIDNPNLVDSTGVARPPLAEAGRRAGRQPSTATTASSPPSTATPGQPAFFTLAYIVRAVAPGPLRASARDGGGHVPPRALRPHRLRHGRGDVGGSDGRAAVPSNARRSALRRWLAAAARRPWCALRRSLRRCGRVALWRFVGRSSARSTCRRLSQGSTVVLDRDGRLLRAFTTADGRWRLPRDGAGRRPALPRHAAWPTRTAASEPSRRRSAGPAARGRAGGSATAASSRAARR